MTDPWDARGGGTCEVMQYSLREVGLESEECIGSDMSTD